MSLGHLSTTLTDVNRTGRTINVEAWFPAIGTPEVTTRYELLPGVAFDSSLAFEGLAPAKGAFPLLVWSHGRTGLRNNYTQLCEQVAAQGFVVVSSDHPGDTLFDWLTGAQVTDEENEKLRLGDVSFLIDSAIDGTINPRLAENIDREMIFVGGHSYGGLTAIVSSTGIHGLPPDPRVRAIIGAQAYTRTLNDDVINRISIPLLFLVGLGDQTTPPITDADPFWNRLFANDDRHRRVDLPFGGHQACSDFAFYIEMLPSIPDVPQLVIDYLDSIAAESPEGFCDTWRNTLATQIDAIVSFLHANS